MKKIILGCIFTACTSHFLFSQQDPQFTMFYFNKMLFNPAYAGAKDAICGTGMFRNQWNGLEGAPNTWMFTGDMPVGLPGINNQLGIGITTYGDYIGFQQDQGMKVALAYRKMNVGPGNLSVGVDLGFTNKNFTNTSNAWIYPSTSEPLPNSTTPSAFAFDLNAGVYYHSQKFYAGVSVLHLTGSNFEAMNMKQARHMYITGGYTFGLSGSSGPWKLNPNVLIRTDFANSNFDLNLNTIYDINGTHGVFFGATYRYTDAIGLNIGYNTNANGIVGILVAYNYDINTSRLRNFNGGSHEIIVRICFRKKTIICTCHPNWRFCKKYINRYGDGFPQKHSP